MKSNLQPTKKGRASKVRFTHVPNLAPQLLSQEDQLRLQLKTPVILLDPKLERNKVQIDVRNRKTFKKEGRILISPGDKTITFVNGKNPNRIRLGRLNACEQENGGAKIDVNRVKKLRGLAGGILAEFMQRLNDTSFDYVLKSAVFERYAVPDRAIMPLEEKQSVVRRLIKRWREG